MKPERIIGSHTYVKNLLFRYGFGYAFEYQDVGDQKQFLSMFKQRLKDNYIQEWHSSTNETSKLKYYCKYKSVFELEKYLVVVSIRKYRIALSKFRCSNHNLEVERGRRTNIPHNLRYCLFCLEKGLSHIEDELHVLLSCPLYEDLRNRYLPNRRQNTTNGFVSLLSSRNVTRINELACYIFHCFNKRSAYLSGFASVNQV